MNKRIRLIVRCHVEDSDAIAILVEAVERYLDLPLRQGFDYLTAGRLRWGPPLHTELVEAGYASSHDPIRRVLGCRATPSSWIQTAVTSDHECDRCRAT